MVLRLRTYVPFWEEGPYDVDRWLVTLAAKRHLSLDQLPPVEVGMRLIVDTSAQYRHTIRL